MGLFDTLGKLANAMVTQAQKQQAQQLQDAARRGARQGHEPTIGGKTLRQWESSWEYLGALSTASLSHLSPYVGLYRATLRGQVVYIGRAVEYSNGGLRKRLSDYTRASDSSRKHRSGQLMHEHADELQIEILKTGTDAEAAEVAVKLERYFIGRYSPPWNQMLKG